MTNKEKIIDAFYKVKDMKWVESHRSNNTGVGKTFEDYVGVVENNYDRPDLFGFEIKSHRAMSVSYVTLFTKSPSYPSNANAYLKDKFGECYEGTTMKKIHTSMFANSFNNFFGKYSFKLENDVNEQKVYVVVYTHGGKDLIDKSVYYTYDDIETILHKKLKNLFLVLAQSRYNSVGNECFYFNSAEIYTNPSLRNFLTLMDNGDIMYDIRMGCYQSGTKIGKPHDHGSGFRIKECNILKLYESKEKVL